MKQWSDEREFSKQMLQILVARQEKVSGSY
jgi:hypothetical protein